MTSPRSPLELRRSWPQRLMILLGVALVAALALGALSLRELDETAASIPRVNFELETPDGRPVDVDAGQPLNFLIVGTDNAEGLDPGDPRLNDRQEDSLLTDVLMVLRLDPVTGQAAVLSIPRDLRVDYASGGTGKINAAYYYGSTRGEGQEELGQTIVDNLDIPIHKYVEIDFVSFASLVDAIDGVPVHFEYPARDRGSLLHIPEAGCWVLDGDAALAYVRGRNFAEYIDGSWTVTGGDDLERNERQQDFLVLAADRAVDRVGRSPSAVRSFLNGVQDAEAITLDDSTSIQELIDLSQAFADFNPENLQRYSLPIYYIDGSSDLGVDETLAEPILDVFRGFDGLRGDYTATLTASGDEDEIDLLVERGLTVTGADIPFGVDDDETVLVLSEDRVEGARAVAAWLTALPEVVVVDGEGILHLHMGDDYAGSRLVPRPDDDEAYADWLADLPVAATVPSDRTDDSAASSTTSTVTTEPSTTLTGGDPGADTVTSTTEAEPEVRGRPPDGADCRPLPEDGS